MSDSGSVVAKKILLIEDAPQVANILVSKLSREGHEVSWRRTREQALGALGASFDLILLSTDLPPEHNSWKILPELKALSAAPVVMLLQAEEAALKTSALAQGASDVIIKPFKPTVVAKRLKELLGP